MSKRLRLWRFYRGLSLREVSERSGVGISTICRAETGRCDLFTRDLRAVVTLGLRASMVRFWGPLPRVPKAVLQVMARRTGGPHLARARAA